MGRLHVVLQGISRDFAAVNIRKYVVRAESLHDLVDLGTIGGPMAAYLDGQVAAEANIVVSDGTQAGNPANL